MKIPREWIRALEETVGIPTDFQWLTWSTFSAGEHYLIRSGTGSGKTLAAFLPCLASLLPQSDHPDSNPQTPGVRILYISPLRSLITDMGNRLRDLVARLWNATGQSDPPRVFELTGDTPSHRRTGFRIDPASILLTTPESLARLLAHPKRSSWFGNLQTVVVDEWHAIAGTKRGADLAMLLERLELVTPKSFSRIAISATIANPEALGQCLVGPTRSCRILAATKSTTIEISLCSIPHRERKIPFAAQILADTCVQSNGSGFLLCFVNSRATAEKLSWQLSKLKPELKIRLHHGSLSRSIRETVESEIRQGLADILIASSSMELGIDLGGIRQVFLLDPPGEVIRFLQRVGRSGRGPGEIPKGVILAQEGTSLFEAAVTSGLGTDGWMESVEGPQEPLDVLCQHLMGEALARPFSPQKLWQTLKNCWNFQNLAWETFEACLSFLSGWPDPEQNNRIPPRLSLVGDMVFVSSHRVARVIRQSLGTITTDPLIPVIESIKSDETDPQTPKLLTDGQRIVGKIDEWYADSIQPGDRFLLNGRSWERTGGNHNEILATEVANRPRALSWSGLRAPFSAALARKLFHLRALAKTHLRESPGSLVQWLQTEFPLKESDARDLAQWFESQDRISQIPEPGMILLESVPWGNGCHWDVHLPLPQLLCYHLGVLLNGRAIRLGFHGIEAEANDLGLRIWDQHNHLSPAGPQTMERWKTLFEPDQWTMDWRESISHSDRLRRHFQNAAEISLMILPPGVNPNSRTRVGGRTWAAQRLFDRIQGMVESPIPMIQAYRDLLNPRDLKTLDHWLKETQDFNWIIRNLNAPSPFTMNWNQGFGLGATDPDHSSELLEIQRALGDA